MHFNVADREITLKVVFYGPPLSGKTTNLQAIHRLLPTDICGRMTTLDTADDRTLFFDMLPVMVNAASGHKIKFKLLTVPGQVVHAATRKLVLSGADGVIFIADSQLAEARINNEYWRGMRRYLEESGIDPDEIPTVIQFNKRDLPNIRTDAEIDDIQRKIKEPTFKAVAVRGEGVGETFRGLLIELFKSLQSRYDFERKFRISGREFVTSVFRAETKTEGGADE